ncbi:MAG: nitrilase-related carbon-nitrogen hydrolase [Maricaulaceae bacterium]
MTTTRIAVLQAAFSADRDANIDAVVKLTIEAAEAGAQIILPPELFQGPYFCRTQEETWFEAARPWDADPGVDALRTVAAERQVVIAASFFERAGPEFFNSLAMIDADGAVLGLYRKSHIPDGPGYQEKYYFRPGDTGFRVWATRYGRVGAGICWDQWFPEAARAMARQDADLLLYPTAIGSEPHDPDLDTRDPWRRAMVGHAVCNVVPVAAANRVGVEHGQRFYGRSFICDDRGDVLTQMDEAVTGFAVADLDFPATRRRRAGWGFFRDRRSELYTDLVGPAPGA